MWRILDGKVESELDHKFRALECSSRLCQLRPTSVGFK
jgi:hypothetical protein